ncbi:MAG: hypothetical protein ACU84J_02355 [Gammaproteobacteria bacterium]
MNYTSIASAEAGNELNTWVYLKDWDTSSNLGFSLARSPLPKRGLYDNIRLEILCRDNKLHFVVDANRLITSSGRAFDLEYQIDKGSPFVIRMTTYPDTKRRGFTDEKVKVIADAMLSGQSVFIRIPTLIKTVLSGMIPLHDAREPIQQVLSDCGVVSSSSSAKASNTSVYGLKDFERDFEQLAPIHRQQVMDKVKTIMDDYR